MKIREPSIGEKVILPRHTEPEAEQRMVLEELGLLLPQQPPPRIRARNPIRPPPRSAPRLLGNLAARVPESGLWYMAVGRGTGRRSLRETG